MRIKMVFEFDDYARRALSSVFGDKTPASRERIKGWVEMVVGSSLDEIKGDYETNIEADKINDAEGE